MVASNAWSLRNSSCRPVDFEAFTNQTLLRALSEVQDPAGRQLSPSSAFCLGKINRKESSSGAFLLLHEMDRRSQPQKKPSQRDPAQHFVLKCSATYK